MSLLTTDLRPTFPLPCVAEYGAFNCTLMLHPVEEAHQASDGTRWKVPMTPRRVEQSQPVLTFNEIIYCIGPAHADIERGPGGVPVVWIGGRPFREVT